MTLAWMTGKLKEKNYADNISDIASPSGLHQLPRDFLRCRYEETTKIEVERSNLFIIKNYDVIVFIIASPETGSVES